jgi:hypothetical protein
MLYVYLEPKCPLLDNEPSILNWSKPSKQWSCGFQVYNDVFNYVLIMISIYNQPTAVYVMMTY